MIKMLRIDDNLLHGQIAFSWVRNLKIHTIVIADDKVVNDQFMKMSLGLAKPMGVNLMIVSVEEAIEFLKQDNKLNVLVIVNSISNASRLCNSIYIKYVNIGLIRKTPHACFHYENMHLQNSDIEIVNNMIKLGINIEYRLRYDDAPVLLKELLNEN